MMFGRFTERAQKVLALAQEEAVRLGHNNIGTEHHESNTTGIPE